jgi:hypothetical protein
MTAMCYRERDEGIQVGMEVDEGHGRPSAVLGVIRSRPIR